MNVNLTPQLEQLVKQKVHTGLYNNASEVVREALRMMAVRDEAAKGFAQLHAGKTVPLNIAAAKRTAKANARKRRVVNPLVTG
ncbi:MAG: type II toxin-antitoxin system ParD family antitoxin [Betaproteobacteria bacterium]|nr:type II toxin-antitoxin system ParD family antitoxin [Betaproteobacteria bacterium]